VKPEGEQGVSYTDKTGGCIPTTGDPHPLMCSRPGTRPDKQEWGHKTLNLWNETRMQESGQQGDEPNPRKRVKSPKIINMGVPQCHAGNADFAINSGLTCNLLIKPQSRGTLIIKGLKSNQGTKGL